MFKSTSFVVGAAATAGLLALGTLGPASAHAASPAAAQTNPTPGTVVTIDGLLQPGFNTTVPGTITLQTQHYGMVTVNVTASTASTPGTKIVRRYNGTSALDEFAAGDNVEAVGSLSGHTLTATTVKDFTIQAAYTRNTSVITAISSDFTKVTAKVLKDSVHQANNPFDEGSLITLNVSPSMSVTLEDGSMGMLQDYLFPGIKITTLGVFNRSGMSFTKVWRIRIDSPSVGDVTGLHGVLQPGFSALTPTTIQVKTPYRGMVTVQVPTTAKFYRRFNGTSSLYEFAAGDWVGLTAIWKGGTTYQAIAIRDDSIQVADSYSLDKITAINLVTPTGSMSPTATISATVLAPGSEVKDNPFKVGQSIVLNANGYTKVMLPNGALGTLSNLAVGQTISANGLVNRKATPMAYTQVATIRVH